MTKIIELLLSLAEKKFWGEVTIKFQNGKPVVINKVEQIKLDKKED
ncbi:MAG: DUF2292 domain-containing protein [Bdellovibrionales bacterium]